MGVQKLGSPNKPEAHIVTADKARIELASAVAEIAV
jgi:hypothetical protein